ncbi:hypothetical protein LXL04_015909 [Taraxacum kok-saghyz]
MLDSAIAFLYLIDQLQKHFKHFKHSSTYLFGPFLLYFLTGLYHECLREEDAEWGCGGLRLLFRFSKGGILLPYSMRKRLSTAFKKMMLKLKSPGFYGRGILQVYKMTVKPELHSSQQEGQQLQPSNMPLDHQQQQITMTFLTNKIPPSSSNPLQPPKKTAEQQQHIHIPEQVVMGKGLMH